MLQALVTTILPFDHPKFPPVASSSITQRLLQLFPLAPDDDDALALRRALVMFNDVGLFRAAPPALLAQELDALDVDGPATPGVVDALRVADETIYAPFRNGLPAAPASFIELTQAQRIAYYALWSQSAFSVKRHFYRASKSLVLVTAWSMDEMWSAIGYAGPLVQRP